MKILVHAAYFAFQTGVCIHGTCAISVRSLGVSRQRSTILLVEHDPDLIDIPDFVVDMGPGSGEAGGEILFSGPRTKLQKPQTPTGEYF